jgi:catechol 2,3-dioxygenase-like lactoylglutathione lyase family enzyme
VLGSARLIAFAATTDAARAKAFYRDVLGLKPVHEDRFAVVFDAHGTTLRVSLVEHVSVAAYTVLGWEVADVVATVGGLVAAGVRFERYPGLEQDENGI